jgi:hypothetical protein
LDFCSAKHGYDWAPISPLPSKAQQIIVSWPGDLALKSRWLKALKILWRSLGKRTSFSKDNGLAQSLGRKPSIDLQCVSGELPKPKRECEARLSLSTLRSISDQLSKICEYECAGRKDGGGAFRSWDAV